MKSLCEICNGNCCASFIITITSFDLFRIMKSTGMKPEEFAELRRLDILAYDDSQVIECEDNKFKDYYLLCLKSHPCYFFDSKKGCRIHGAKPMACRIYPFNEGGRFSDKSMCPLFSGLLFRASKSPKEQIIQYKKEKELYADIVKKCNSRNRNRKSALEFLVSETEKHFDNI